MTVRLNRDELHDKVMGCWLGKSIGGTLGAPLEGRKGLFDLTYYDPVPEGAIFNDDLDIQLVWLRALQLFGPDLTTREMGEMWLKHVIYPWDEYGYGAFNLRKGLLPPVSGAFNNWYVDCEGSPIRSEIWAMVAPAAPEVAARYAYADAIIDHAGGEGVWGEMYLAALESAAFVVDDAHELIEIGLSLIPEDCRTARAVRDVLRWHGEGVEWVRCRELLLEHHGHYNPQDSPQNQGIVTLGWLYGEGDFGESILKAVNCGEDTDCTGATLGSIMGIVHGAEAIPARWKDPVSGGIAVGWGIVGLDYPTDLEELTRQTLEITEQVVAAKAPWVQIVDGPTDASDVSGLNPPDLRAPELMREVQAADPMTATYEVGGLRLHVSYDGTPTIGDDAPARVRLTLESCAEVPVGGELSLLAPQGLQVEGGGEFALSRRGAEQVFECSFAAERSRVKLQVTNPITVRIALEGHDAQIVRFPLLGERVWLVAGPFAGGIHDTSGPEEGFDPLGEWQGRDGMVRFERRSFAENQMPLGDLLGGEPGVIYALTYVFSSVDTHVVFGLDSSGDFRLYLDGESIGQVVDPPPVRPVRYRFGVDVERGWRQVAVKLVGADGTLDFHFHLMDDRPEVPGTRGHGRTDLINTYLPDEIAHEFH